jgi:hypothetical protein
MVWEPVLTRTLLPRCAACQAPHPLARTPKAPTGKCPDCGHPSGPEQSETVPAVLTGRRLWTRVARLFFTLGRQLRGLAERIDP